jgi:hypothetical protein
MRIEEKLFYLEEMIKEIGITINSNWPDISREFPQLKYRTKEQGVWYYGYRCAMRDIFMYLIEETEEEKEKSEKDCAQLEDLVTENERLRTALLTLWTNDTITFGFGHEQETAIIPDAIKNFAGSILYPSQNKISLKEPKK